MTAPPALHVFTEEQQKKLHNLLALQVARMMGRKMEEDDWTDAYCKAKGFPKSTWSNLDIDVTAGNLGIEQKMLKVKNADITESCGTTLMHPSLTRSVRIDDTQAPADAMKSVFEQYADLLDQRRTKIQEQNTTGLPVELRTGWLLWQESLSQFLYFEEPTIAPDARDYEAQWRVSPARGGRKESRNLWIFERETQRKRYSVTSAAGTKIQPYFDVPSVLDPNLYIFTIIGERILLQTGNSNEEHARLWVTPETAKAVEAAAGSLDSGDILRLITRSIDFAETLDVSAVTPSGSEAAVPLMIPYDQYDRLRTTFKSFNDDELMLTVLRHS